MATQTAAEEGKTNGKSKPANDLATQKTKTLAAKLAAIMGEVERVPKNGYNQHFKYEYVTEADLTAHVRPLLARHNIGLVFCMDAVRQLENNITEVKITYTLVDGDSGEREVMSCFGYGQDKNDKGIYKAITGATKYWLYKTFLISTGDDPETEIDGQQQAAPPGRPTVNQQRNAQPQQTGGADSTLTEDEQLRVDYGKYEQDAITMRGFTNVADLDAWIEQNRPQIESNRYRSYYIKLIQELRDFYRQQSKPG